MWLQGSVLQKRFRKNFTKFTEKYLCYSLFGTLLKAFRLSGLQPYQKFWKIFKKIFWQNTCGRWLVVFMCELWEVFQNTFFIEHLWTAYFMDKLQNFNKQI